VKFVVLLTLRAVTYHRTKNHYFMFDFCYFANAWVMAYLWSAPDSCMMFHTAFSFTHGPLIWAILAWRNSLVFHSLDKITSVYIHLTPTLLMWALHQFPDGQFNTCQAEYPHGIPFSVATLWPLLPYLVWQIAYSFKVEFLDHKKIEKHGLTTSFRYLSSPNGPLAKWCSYFGEERWKKVSIFMCVQLLYTILTMLGVAVWWANSYLHTAFLVFVCLACTWNGANFYFEVFSKRYEDQMKNYAKNWAEVDAALQQLKKERGESNMTTSKTKNKDEKKII
jgi:Protein of unknown function (DUF2838)